MWSNHYIDLTESLINSIYNEFGIDFTQDDSLFIELALHIKDMHSRLKNNAIIRNLVLEDLKRKYPLIYEIGVFACNEFYRIANIEVNEHEIGFIALHLGAAYERLRRDANSLIRVAIVCSTDYSISNLLHSKINSLYSDKVDVIGVFSFLEIYSLAHINPDIIFTTVEFEHNLHIPTIVISPFLNRQDIKIINKNFNLFEKKSKMKRLQVDIEKYFTSKLFYKNKSFYNEFDIINFMTQDLYEKGFVPEEYTQLVKEREKISATSLGNLVAMPHSIVMNAYATVVSVAILDKPMLWGEHKVQLVFMFAIKSGERKKTNELYNYINEIIDTQEGVDFLMKTNDFNDFINRILNY